MNATDRLAVGLVVIGGGSLVDTSGFLSGVSVPAFWVGFALVVSGCWKAGKAAGEPDSKESQ